MPRKKALKRKIRNKITDLENAQEQHSSKKSIFGGLRLVLPSMTGNTTTTSLPARSKAAAIHTSHWAIGESGLQRPLNLVEAERIESSWTRWSSIEPKNIADNKIKSETSPQKTVKQSRKTKLQPRLTTIQDENTSRYIMAVNQGRRFSKIDPPAEPLNVQRPGLHDTMNNLMTITRSSATEESRKPEPVSVAPIILDCADSESNVLLESVMEPKLTEYEYYQQRSAHGGRLGIEERIDVFEPQMKSQQQYIEDLDSLPLRILVEDESTTRDSTYATSSKSLYTPSNMTQSSINESHVFSAQMDQIWPPDSDHVNLQTEFLSKASPSNAERAKGQNECILKASSPNAGNLRGQSACIPEAGPCIDTEPHSVRQESNVFSANDVLPVVMNQPGNDEVDRRMDNSGAQNIHSAAAEENSPARIVLPQKEILFGTGRSRSDSDAWKTDTSHNPLRAEPFSSSLPLDSRSANEVPMTRELTETDEIDRLLAILDQMTSDTTNANKVEVPRNRQHESSNIPPRHNSPRKLFPASESPTKVKDFGSEPSMSSDGTFTERLKREAFALFDEDDENMIENPFPSPSGMESLYSKSLSESPQHTVFHIEHQADGSAEVKSTDNDSRPEKTSPLRDEFHSDSMERAPSTQIEENAPLAISKSSNRSKRQLIHCSENFDEHNLDIVERSKREPEFLSGRKFHETFNTTMRDDVPLHTDPRILQPKNNFMNNSEDFVSQLPGNPERYSRFSTIEKHKNSPLLQTDDKSDVASTFKVDKSTDRNSFSPLQNGSGQVLQRPERKFKDSQQRFLRFDFQQSSPSFIENDQTHLPNSSNVHTLREQPTAFTSDVVPNTSKVSILSSPKMYVTEYRQSIVDQSFVGSNFLYDDSGNRIVRRKDRSPVLNAKSTANSNVTTSPFTKNDQKTVATSNNIRLGPKQIASGSYPKDSTHMQRLSSNAMKYSLVSRTEQSTSSFNVSPSRKEAPPDFIKKQGYASSPIRNYWREYSNVRTGGSFDSMSLKNDRSEENIVFGTVAQNSSFLNSTSEENCSNADKCDIKSWDKRNQGNYGDDTEPCSRSFQSSKIHQPCINRNSEPIDNDDQLRHVTSFNLQPKLMQHEFHRAEKYTIPTPADRSIVMQDNINSPETEFMNFSTASQRATKEYNSRVQRAISPVKFSSENHVIAKDTNADASSFLSIRDSRNTDDTKITPILRYKQYANDDTHPAGAKGLSIAMSSNGNIIAPENVKLQSVVSHDSFAHVKPREQHSFDSGFVRKTSSSVAETHQTSMLQNDCPSFDSDNAIADDLVEVLSVASSEVMQGVEAQNIRSNENHPISKEQQPKLTRILPPWPPTIQNQFSDTVASKESFEGTSCITEPNDVRDLVQRTILPKPDNRWKDSKQSVYSNDLPSPLRHRLINAMSPMLSGDTMDEDSVSEWSSRYDPSRAGGSEAANAQCCSILSCFDFGSIEEKLRAICRFDN